jgi:hypothetical protein
MNRFSLTAFARALFGGTGALLLTLPAHAQWLANNAISEIEHGYYATAPGGALPIFDPIDGQMFQPGGGYPTTAANPIAQRDTGVVGLPNVLISGAGPAGGMPVGFGGAGTALSLVNGGNRIGIAVNQYYVYDRSPLGFASTNIYGGSADFLNALGVPIAFKGGQFIGFRGRVGVGGYVAVGVRSVFEVFNAQGGLIQSVIPTPIVWASNGDGNFGNDVGLADFGIGYDLGAAGVGFSASSLVNLVVPAGGTLRMRGTVTVIADPDSDVEIDTVPLDNSALPLPEVGLGVSSNASAVLAPEPGTLALLIAPGFALLGRRRRTF